MSLLWNPQICSTLDEKGRIADGALAYFYLAGTTDKLNVYQDYELTTPHEWPVVADYNGVFPPVFIPYVDFGFRVTTKTLYPLRAVSRVSNPAPPSAGGGGGIVVTSDQIFQTGDMMFNYTGATRAGWVRMNGRTIGNAISSATEYANNSALALFAYLWNGLPNSIAAVSGGRGASASADWAANKTIVVPSWQGLTPVGVDDMGSAAANTIQVSGTCSATSGNQNVSVSSAAGLARGMYFIIAGVAAGQITEITGTTVKLSTAYAGTTGTGKAFRASFFSDAQTIGIKGGSQSFSMTTAELAAHTHTDAGHTHQYAKMTGGSGFAAGATSVLVFDNTAVGYADIQNTGKGQPMPLIQPGRLVTFYMKL